MNTYSNNVNQTSRHVLRCYFSHLLFVSYVISLVLGDVWLLLPAAFILILVPSLDLIFPKTLDVYEISDFSPFQISLMKLSPILFTLLYVISLTIASYVVGRLGFFDQLYLVASVGMMGSIAISASHELVHKKETLEKNVGRLGLLFMGYMHFEVNHLYGHHRYSCTEVDENTGWKDESIYSYLFRTIPGSFKAAFKYAGIPGINLYFFLGMELLVVLGWFVLFGLSGLMLLIAQASISVTVLEIVSYIEHYGLMRGKEINGKAEKMKVVHSWNTYHRFSSYLTFFLQRHADHHSNASKPYYILKADKDAPELPAGYPVLIGLTLLPSLWRRIVDPILDRHLESIRQSLNQSKTEKLYDQSG